MSAIDNVIPNIGHSMPDFVSDDYRPDLRSPCIDSDQTPFEFDIVRIVPSPAYRTTGRNRSVSGYPG